MPSRIRLYLRETSGVVHRGRNVEARLLEMAPVTLRKLRADPRWARQPRWKRCKDLAAEVIHTGFSIRRERRGLRASESQYRQGLYQAGLLPQRALPRQPNRTAQGGFPIIGVYGRNWIYNNAWVVMSAEWRAHHSDMLARGVRHYNFQGRRYDAYLYIERRSLPANPEPRVRGSNLNTTAVLFSSSPPSLADPRPSGPYSPPLGIWRQ